MEEIIKGNEALLNTLSELSLDTPEDSVTHSQDQYGNAQHWFVMKTPDLLTEAAKALKEAGARLCMISGYSRASGVEADASKLGACYNFVLDGIIYNINVQLDRRHPETPTITPWFFNADWHEREMMELVGINVKDHPNPTRLFLDPELDKGLLGKVIPLSVMMNGACSTDLWEHILSEKGGRR